MSIKYQVVYGDGSVSQRKEESCFAKLKDFNGQVEWNNFKDPKEHDGLVGIKYQPNERWSDYDAALAYWEYLLSKPLWADVVLNKDEGVHAMLADGVTVSVETTPFHMLNTLSIFRHVYTFQDGVLIFKKLIDAGCNHDMAFMASALLQTRGDDSIAPRRDEDAEHTVICHRTMTATDYLNYLGVYQDTPPVSKKDSKLAYQLARKYVRGGVATWFTKTDDRGKNTDEGLLITDMLPSDYTVVYDKETKAVVSCSKTPAHVKLADVAMLAEHLNKLHDSIAAK